MKTKLFRVTVEGNGMFPVDMLRYDAAYPSTERDSGTIMGDGLRKVDVAMKNPPTEARWQSFGWIVLNVAKIY